MNLYEEHIEVLNLLAKRQGSRSAAVQRLLEQAKRDETYRELDEAYRRYNAGEDTGEDQELTAELLRATSWPEEWLEGSRREGKRRRGEQGQPR